MLRTLAAFTMAATLANSAHAAAPRPNIIFVLTDDLGWGDLGVYFQNSRNFAENRNLPAFETPGLDAMAAQGLRMDHHYCPAPVCAPSRASLLLGVHQGHSNVRDNQFDKAIDNNHTVATVLKQAGYATAVIGKWGLQGGGGFPGHPLNRGFDYFHGYIPHIDAHYHYPKEQGRAYYENFTNIVDQLDKCYSTDLATARTKQWIVDHQAANPAQPFFVFLAYAAPHAQLNVPTGPYPAGGGLTGGVQWTGTPGAMINTATGTVDTWIHPDYATATWDHDNNPATAEVAWPSTARRHATMVRRLDDAMADLFQLLADLEIDDDTLVVFTSDNGPHNEAGAGGGSIGAQNPRFFRSYGPLDGVKRDLWEGGIRVPTLARWPASIPAGRVSTHPSQFHDWMPTFADLAGLPLPFRSDGVSLVPDLTGTGSQREGVVYVEYTNGGAATTPNYNDFDPSHRGATRGHMQAVFLNGYKGVRYNTTAAGTPFRVYDVASDPQETTNLAGQPGAPTQAELEARVAQIRRTGGGVSRVYDGVNIPAVAAEPVKPGMHFAAYEGDFPWVPDFTTITPAASGETTGINLSGRTRDHDIGMAFEGYLLVPATGTYTFFLTTDTGAFVRLHDAQLIDADFGYTANTERSSGAIPLAAGLHPIRIHSRHADAATHALTLQWQGPGIAKQPIPDGAFFIEGEPEPAPPAANPDETSTITGVPTEIAVLNNDNPGAGPDPLTITNVTQPAHGSATITSDGTNITYAPAIGYIGEDSFSYTISNGLGSSTATVSISVLPATSTIWLPFDETSGTIARDALGRPLGVLTGFATPGWVPGRLGGALRFFGDGDADGVVLTGNKGVTGTAARTITFWLNADAEQGSGTRSTIISWGADNSGTAGIRFDINLNHSNNYRLRAEFNASGVNFTTPAHTDLRGAGWVHCAIVVPQNATVSQILGFLDGVAATPQIEPGASGGTAINTSAANDVTIGNWATDVLRPFRGIIDDVRIYPRALSAGEIATLASQTPDQAIATAWFFRHAGNDIPTAADWEVDNDGDSLPFLLEFALGGNPTVASRAPAPYLSDEFEFAFNRRQAGLPAAAYVAEFSTTLEAGTWQPADITSVVEHPEMPGFDQVRVALPVTAEARAFMRLRVSAP